MTNPNKLTQKQESLLSRLVQGMTPKEIAEYDQIKVDSVYDMLEQLRLKYRNARQFVNEFDANYRRKLRKYLW